MKRKPSPQLSSSSSSEEDEDATSEEEAQSKEDLKQQPKQVQEDEESEEEEEESSDDEEKGEKEEEDEEEEEDDEEEEEDGEDDNEKVIDLSSPRSSQFKIAVRETAAEKPKSPPPPAKQKHGAVKPPAKPVESKPTTTDTKKAKSAVSSPLKVPPSSPPQKRAADVKEVNDKEANGSKKRKVGDTKPDQNSPAVVSVDNDQKRRRVWDDENEVRLLRTYLEHLRKGVNDNEIYDDVLKVLGGSFNKRQLREKMRNLKIKYEAVKEKATGKPVFKTPHEEELYEFGEKIWGDREDSEQKDLQEHTRNEKSNANSIGRGNNNAKISGVERSSSISKVDNGEPDSKLKKSSVAYMEIDVHPNGDNHVVEGKKDVNCNQNGDKQTGVKVSAQILENGDLQGDLCEYEMVESEKLYMKTDDLVKEGLSIAVKSGNLEFQQELKELDRMKKELKVLQLEIILRQVKLAQAAIGAQKY